MGRPQIVWDLPDDEDGNVRHILEHDVSVDEVEDVLLNDRNPTIISRESGNPITFGWTTTGRISPSRGRASATTPG